MAEFNPQPQFPTAPDFTGVSRGTGPNRAFEALFSGIGDAVEAGVQTRDNFIQNQIEDDARYSFEALNEENNLTPDTVPSELTQSAQGLQRIALAHQQGKVTQEYYYQRLASTLKGLRAKYPGYEKEVDNIVSQVTGTRPANAFRDAMFANIEAANRELASSGDRFQKFVTQDGNIGYVQMAFPDFFENPGKYTEQEVVAGVAKLKGQEQTWQSQKLQMEGNKEFANQGLNERLNQVTSSLLEGSSRAFGLSGSDFLRRLNDFSKKGGMTPEEKSQFVNQYEQFISATRTALIKETSDPVFQKLFTPNELQERREAALNPLIQIRDLINNDQYDQAAMLVARNNNLQNQARSALYKTDPRLLGVDAISKISPESADWLINNMIQEAGGVQSYFDKVALTDMMAGIISGDDTINEGLQRIINNKASTQADKNAQAGDVVKKFTGALKSKTLRPEEIARVVEQNYLLDGEDMFSMVDSSTDAKGNSQYFRLYNEMFSPEVTKAIVESGSTEALNRYTEAAIDKFQAIPEFRKAASDLAENIDYGRFLRAHYDEGTNRLVLEADQGAISNLGFFNRQDNKLFVNRAIKAKDALNQALSIVAPIIEANGGNETEGIQTIIKNMAIDLEPQDRGGFFRWVNDQLDRLIAGPDATKEEDRGIARPDSPLGRAIQRRSDEIESERAPEGTWTEIGSTETPDMDDEDIAWELPADTSESDLGGALSYASTSGGTSEEPFNAVLRAGRGFTEIQRPDGSVVRRSGARNWRNNNPGNIEFGPFARSQGALGSDGRFAVFPTYEAGRKAKAALLFESKGYRNKTIAQAISRYAPAFENDTNAYTNAVARAVGVPADTPVSSLTPAQRERMLNAMERVEGFRVGREVVLK